MGAISKILNQPHNYHGAPHFGYNIGEFFIDKEGNVTGEYDETLMAGLAERGFVPQPEETSAPVTSPDSITIEVPLEGFTPESLDNLSNLSGNSGFRYDSPDRPVSTARVRIPAPIINETPEQKAKRELMQLWANTDKRREFIRNYSEWGVWLTVPELGLTCYKYDLPDGGRILAMEYQHESHYSGEEGCCSCPCYYSAESRFAPT